LIIEGKTNVPEDILIDADGVAVIGRGQNTIIDNLSKLNNQDLRIFDSVRDLRKDREYNIIWPSSDLPPGKI
jgi:hypothetical protein